MSENTTVPAVFVSRDPSLGYGRTGRAAPRDCGWSFFPDGEMGRSISCLEEELFFPQAPAALDVSTASGFEIPEGYGMILTIRYRYSLTCYQCHLFFPWGEEIILNRCQPPINWRTADPLSGEWELVYREDFMVNNSGILKFVYHPAPAPELSLVDIAARDAARLEATGVNDPAATYKAWMKGFNCSIFPVGASEVQRAPTAEQPIFAMTNRKLLEKIHGTLVKAAEQKRVAKLRRGLQHMRDFAPACYDTGGPGREMVDAVSDLVRHLFGPEPK